MQVSILIRFINGPYIHYNMNIKIYLTLPTVYQGPLTCIFVYKYPDTQYPQLEVLAIEWGFITYYKKVTNKDATYCIGCFKKCKKLDWVEEKSSSSTFCLVEHFSGRTVFLLPLSDLVYTQLTFKLPILCNCSNPFWFVQF